MSVEQRLQTLERLVDRITGDRSNALVRAASAHQSPNKRLARATEGEVTYPTTGNTFPIVFLDGSYTLTQGNQSPDWTPRQEAAYVMCQNLAGTIPPVGTVMGVWNWSERWWCEYRTTTSSSDVAIVRVESTGGSACDAVNPNSACVYDGKIVTEDLGQATQCGSIWSAGEDVWIIPVNACPVATQLRKGQRYLARKVGPYTVSSVTRDLYQVQDSSGSSDASAVVRFFESSGFDDGELREPNASGVYAGVIQTQTLAGDQSNGGVWADGADCWIFPTNNLPVLPAMHHNERFVARFAGTYSVGDDERPLYQIHDRPYESYCRKWIDTGAAPVPQMSMTSHGGTVTFDGLNADSANRVELGAVDGLTIADAAITVAKGGLFRVSLVAGVNWSYELESDDAQGFVAGSAGIASSLFLKQDTNYISPRLMIEHPMFGSIPKVINSDTCAVEFFGWTSGGTQRWKQAELICLIELDDDDVVTIEWQCVNSAPTEFYAGVAELALLALTIERIQ